MMEITRQEILEQNQKDSSEYEALPEEIREALSLYVSTFYATILTANENHIIPAQELQN
jgi:hypothetical protein